MEREHCIRLQRIKGKKCGNGEKRLKHIKDLVDIIKPRVFTEPLSMRAA